MVYPHCYRTENSETRTTNATYGEYYAMEQSKKIKVQPELLKILQYVDSNRAEFITDIKRAVEIKSVSANLEYKKDVIKMVKFTENWLIKLGVKYECFNIGYHELNGQKVRLPPIILGSIGNDPTKNTICVYGYLDVRLPNDKWETDPWTATNLDKKIYGNGVAAGKGPLICWFHVVAAFQSAGVPLPVNLKFIIESMHKNLSEGLEGFLISKKLDFLFNIDYIVIIGSEWIGDKYPCLVYGCVGIIHFTLTVEKMDNSTTEPKEDLKKILGRFVNEKEKIQIPEFYDSVAQITPDEEKLYENIQDFDPLEIRHTLPPEKQNWDKVKLLMHFWRLPAISIEDIQECTCDKKDFTKVKADFVLKIVPRQIVDKITSSTIKHVKNVCEELAVQNKVDIELKSATRPWLEDCRSHNYRAARRATIQVYKEDPNMIRVDRDSRVINILTRIIEKSILFLPLGNKSGNAGNENENVSLRNFYEGTKLLGAYLFQVGVKERPKNT